jgi:hypothetical protein
VGAGDEDLVASVVLGRLADIKTIKAMDGEGASLSRCLMNDHPGTRNSKWCSIKIEIAEQACVGRELRLATRGTKEVQGEIALWEEIVPSRERKGRICSGQTSDEMVLPCLDGSLGGVTTMLVGRDTLEINIVFAEGFFDVCGAFVV